MRRIEFLIFVEIRSLNCLVKSVPLRLKNVFRGTIVDSVVLNIKPHWGVVGVQRIWADSALVKLIVPRVGEIGLVRSALLGWVPLKHCLRIILSIGAGFNLLITVYSAQTDVTGVKRLHIDSTVTTRVTDPNQTLFNHGQRMPVKPWLPLLSGEFFIILDPFFLVIAFGGIQGLWMNRVELVLKGVLSFVEIHFGQFVKLWIHFLMNIFDQLPVHHWLGQKLVVKLLLWNLLFFWNVLLTSILLV